MPKPDNRTLVKVRFEMFPQSYTVSFTVITPDGSNEGKFDIARS